MVSLTHAFIHTVPDGPDPTVVRPSNWNAEHRFIQTSGAILGRLSPDDGDVEELPPTDVRTMLNVANGATANSSDAFLLDRANHTGTESADVLTDGTTNKAFLATERTKLAGIATGATANSSDAFLLARANHTGTESADVLTDGATNKAFLATERTKLAGIAAGATVNSADAFLLARANHTGTQLASTVSDFSTAADLRITTATGVTVEAFYSTTVALAAATVPNTVLAVQLGAYAAVGDGGNHKRKRVALQPTWGGIRSTDRFLPNGTTDATNGGWWDVDEAQPNEMMFGGVASLSNAVQTAAIQSLLDYCYGNPGRKAYNARSHTITAQINMPAGVCLEWGWGFPSAVFGQGAWIKGFNGDMIRMGDASVLVRPLLQGVGATWTGRGILIDQGQDQVIIYPFINDMAGPCIEFPTDSVGGRFRCEGGYFLCHTVTDPCIVFPAVESTTFGYRMFNNPGSGGGTLFAFKNGNMTQITGGFSAGVDFTGNTTGRVFMTGHRVANALTTIIGTQHHITHNSFGGNVTLGGTASEVELAGNILSGTITLNAGAIRNEVNGNHSTTGNAVIDNSGATGTNMNIIDDALETQFSPTWTGSVTNPVLGNGISKFFWSRKGKTIRIHGRLDMGSTTTFGSGFYSFALPIAGLVANGACVGSAIGVGATFFAGSATIADGTAVINLAHHGGSNFWGALIPGTWASGNWLSFDITVSLK